MVGVGVVAQWFCEAAPILKPVIGLLPKLLDAVLLQEAVAYLLGGRLPGDSLRAVLAKFERRCVLGIGPGTTRAVETIGFILAEQCPRTSHDDLLVLERERDRFQRAPAAGGAVVIRNSIRPLFRHRHSSLIALPLAHLTDARCEILPNSSSRWHFLLPTWGLSAMLSIRCGGAMQP